jgi:hypothetical protein
MRQDITATAKASARTLKRAPMEPIRTLESFDTTDCPVCRRDYMDHDLHQLTVCSHISDTLDAAIRQREFPDIALYCLELYRITYGKH